MIHSNFNTRWVWDGDYNHQYGGYWWRLSYGVIEIVEIVDGTDIYDDDSGNPVVFMRGAFCLDIGDMSDTIMRATGEGEERSSYMNALDCVEQLLLGDGINSSEERDNFVWCLGQLVSLRKWYGQTDIEVLWTVRTSLTEEPVGNGWLNYDRHEEIRLHIDMQGDIEAYAKLRLLD